ncbi:MAG TPA: hypothetical protein VII66_13115 [Gemmatimonadaceae bacterium]
MTTFGSANFITVLLGLIGPVLTGYVTLAMVGLTKKIAAFDASSPIVKQVVSFIYAAIPSLAMAYFGSNSISVILNTLIGGALAQLFHNGTKVTLLPPAPSLTTASAISASSASGTAPKP